MTGADAWLLLAAAALVVLAGLFSAADAALGSFSRARAEELLAEQLPLPMPMPSPNVSLRLRRCGCARLPPPAIEAQASTLLQDKAIPRP